MEKGRISRIVMERLLELMDALAPHARRVFLRRLQLLIWRRQRRRPSGPGSPLGWPIWKRRERDREHRTQTLQRTAGSDDDEGPGHAAFVAHSGGAPSRSADYGRHPRPQPAGA